jgi:hypothetical protein
MEEIQNIESGLMNLPTKAKRFAVVNIRKITGGKDPVRLVEDFIVRQGFDPKICLQEKTADSARWMIPLGVEEELEVLAENLKTTNDTTIYMGVNVLTVPIRGSTDILAAALQIADALVGIKLSLVGHYLVLSASVSAAEISVEEIDYYYKLMHSRVGLRILWRKSWGGRLCQRRSKFFSF